MSNYTHGTMSTVGQDKTLQRLCQDFSIFKLPFSLSLLLMPILVFGAKLGWPIALVITFIVGLLISPAFKLGGGWYATLFGPSGSCGHGRHVVFCLNLIRHPF